MTQAKRHRSQRHGNDEHAESERRGEAAGAAYRRKLVDEVCSVCGYERKYAIKVLNGNRPGPRGLCHGSRVKKHYDKPQTPAQRLLNWKGLSMEKKKWIETMQHTLDPIALNEAVSRTLQVIRRVLREGVRDAA